MELREIDLWALREVAHSEAIRSGEMVGRNLTMKIVQALFEIKHQERTLSNRLLNEVYSEGNSNIENGDLATVNAQIGELINELSELNGARDTIIQHVQRLNEVALHLKEIRLIPLKSEATQE